MERRQCAGSVPPSRAVRAAVCLAVSQSAPGNGASCTVTLTAGRSQAVLAAAAAAAVSARPVARGNHLWVGVDNALPTPAPKFFQYVIGSTSIVLELSANTGFPGWKFQQDAASRVAVTL